MEDNCVRSTCNDRSQSSVEELELRSGASVEDMAWMFVSCGVKRRMVSIYSLELNWVS